MCVHKLGDVALAETLRGRLKVAKGASQLTLTTMTDIAASYRIDDLPKVLAVAHELETEAIGRRRRGILGGLDNARTPVRIEQRRDRNHTFLLAFLIHPFGMRGDERVARRARSVDVAVGAKRRRDDAQIFG